MTEQIAADPIVPERHEHAGVQDPGTHHSPEHIKKEIRVYLIVFGALTVLTAATVFACFGLKLPVHYAIMVALTIATMKGFLVAGFFMHLLTEKRLIYGVLILTVVFFAALLWLPVHDVIDKF
ncbi:MAG TPA: cytochrome C oxidase subunit IV family protein [Thermoanaerobaculia bacterium]|nr:cytochrome C oxidase subunit IV family protein [Thermoanaerobaculia bacterium]